MDNERQSEKEKCRYAVIWDDGFPTTLHESFEEARKLLRETEEKSGTGGRILTVEEYLGR